MRRTPSMRTWNLATILVPAAVLFATTIAMAKEGPAWKKTDSTIALIKDGETLWQFNYGKDLSKPFFHPLALEGVGTLTSQAPPDHPWHHAHWFCWKFINGVNYWEENRETGISDGITEWKNVKIVQNENFSTNITMDLDYHLPGEEPILTEKRRVYISAPREGGNYAMNWTLTFRAGSEDVVFDRTPIPGEEGGKGHGGYAGLSVRFVEELSDWKVTDSDGNIKEQGEKLRVKSRAVDFNGLLDGQPVGIAILDHPNNLNAPTTWYIIMAQKGPMRYFSPAVIHDGPHTLKAGKSFTLRYRVLIHKGRYTSERLAKELERFETPKKKSK